MRENYELIVKVTILFMLYILENNGRNRICQDEVRFKFAH